MGDDSIIECVPQGGKVNAFTSWTSGNPNYGDSREGIVSSSKFEITQEKIKINKENILFRTKI